MRTKSVALSGPSFQNRKYWYSATVAVETGDGTTRSSGTSRNLPNKARVWGYFTGSNGRYLEYKNFEVSRTTGTGATLGGGWKQLSLVATNVKFCVTSIKLEGYWFVTGANDCSLAQVRKTGGAGK